MLLHFVRLRLLYRFVFSEWQIQPADYRSHVHGHSNAHGHGYGSRLVEFAIRKKRIYKVDVNEQNAAALGFYLHMGFETTGRDALDATGKPFPILHLQIPPIRLRKATLEDIDLLRTPVSYTHLTLPTN